MLRLIQHNMDIISNWNACIRGKNRNRDLSVEIEPEL